MDKKIERAIKEVEKCEKQVASAEKEAARLERELKVTLDKEKNLKRSLSELTRRARTKRLIERGAILETFLIHPEWFDNEEVRNLLSVIFNQEGAKYVLNSFLNRLGEALENEEIP